MSDDLPVPLFYNPISGRGRAAGRIEAVSELLTGRGIAHERVSSSGKGDMESLVANACREGKPRILVAGGDGSIHEAVNGMMAAGTSAALGVVPLGTGNDFAKAVAIPLDWEHATELLADRMKSGARPKAIDIGRCNRRYFANTAGIGLDARVAADAERLKLPIGDAVYLVALLRTVLEGLATPSMVIRYADVTVEGPVLLANFANGPWEGGMFHIAPGAENNDGALELVYADPVGLARLVTLLPKLMRGTHLDAPEVHHRRVERCVVECEAPVIAHLDGEIQAPASCFEVEVLPGALRLL